MELDKSPLRTVFLKDIIEKDEAKSLYVILKESIEWDDGIPSRIHGFTRKAKALNCGDFPLIDELIKICLDKLTVKNKKKYIISHIYLNYYENGEMFTPNHSHQGTHQLVISLGGMRILEIGKKRFPMENGDAILFGSSTHGIPKMDTNEGRISIATFMVPIC